MKTLAQYIDENLINKDLKIESEAKYEFNTIKSWVLNSKYYNKYVHSDITCYRLPEFDFKPINLLKFCGDNKNDEISISIDNCREDKKWKIRITLCKRFGKIDDFKYIVIEVPTSSCATFVKLLNNHVEPIFNNFETFTQYIKENS